MRSALNGTRGFAGIMLVLIIVWALAAVLMLTGTIIAASRIDDSVAVIRPEVSDINTDTKLVALAAKTAKTSERIKDAAEPLTGELTKTLAAAKSIDGTAKSIDGRLRTTLSRASTINGNVLTIGGTVGRINGNVNAIGGTVRSINSNARSINASARGINASAQSINASARAIDVNTDSINSSVRGIRGNASTILSRVVVIDGRVAGINRRAITAREVASSLGADLNAVLRLVVSGPRTIDGHANSIDCSTLFKATGNNEACNR